MQALFYVFKQGVITRHKAFCKFFGGSFEASD
jgi:hypothetical protein